MNAADVLAGAAMWACEQGDAIAFLNALPDDSVDLLFTSPPYLEARTYGTEGVSRKLAEWVPWMVSVVTAAAPKVKGLIAVNCEGQTRNYAYQPAPFLLIAELFKAGFNLRKPPIFHRVGIPGSGGPDWLRNDYEPIVCVTREGKLPWSDNVACGSAPKFTNGGPASHRKTGSDERVNVKRKVSYRDGPPTTDERNRVGSHRSRRACGYEYIQPEIVNPGNVIHCKVGGGAMGINLAHANEAPFPLELAAFFVRSFCPPNGVVCDPFSGSGTTCHAAVENGRRFVGCDLRQSQVELCERRMKSGITPTLFADAEEPQ